MNPAVPPAVQPAAPSAAPPVTGASSSAPAAPAGWRARLAAGAHAVVALLVAINGALFVAPLLRRAGSGEASVWAALDTWRDTIDAIGVLELPRLVLGAGVLLMAVGLLLRARVAWAFSLALLLTVALFVYLGAAGLHRAALLSYTLLVVVLLCASWRQFDRASLAAGSLFALVSVGSLLLYAVFGALYLGAEFVPALTDLPQALYFAVVTMATVGYGDIVPHSTAARFFTVSIIILGITVFATAVSAVIGPIIGGSLKRLVRGRISHAMRKNHVIIAGATPLAQSVYQGMRGRDFPVTVIVPPGVPHEFPADADLIIDDPSSATVLATAGAARARFILALRDDDADNAFIVLAAKEVAGPDTKTVAMVSASKHLQKMRRVQPDMVFSLQLLGSELLARTLTGEPIDHRLVTDLFFAQTASQDPAPQT
ncbi:voltage-gated potassium channel TrkA [Bordetella genomosp. 5]|uniref:voltage-gated potassium channel protein n=1 Tax=Bordetella genomosp. 5 TaxID=1395608 RepID=UPI000B9EBA0E|nr:voltage-gated potassium channel protein [Bordetella genomosp. 5]OZI36831.1 voltage-gated potassium channel TrkA [Bordetella genomosp. 5]